MHVAFHMHDVVCTTLMKQVMVLRLTSEPVSIPTVQVCSGNLDSFWSVWAQVGKRTAWVTTNDECDLHGQFSKHTGRKSDEQNPVVFSWGGCLAPINESL